MSPSLTATPAHRHPVVSFDTTIDAQPPPGCSDAEAAIITTLRSRVPGLKLYTRSSPQYEVLRGCYNKHVTARPLVICRPATVAQLQDVVRTVRSLGGDVPLGVRCGGHDVFGRGCVADSVTVDMRELDALVLDQEGRTVAVGGGVIGKNLVGFLDAHGLGTAGGFAGEVGWTAWAA
jgi:FAD/FMN-containing dehydrogenase